MAHMRKAVAAGVDGAAFVLVVSLASLSSLTLHLTDVAACSDSSLSDCDKKSQCDPALEQNGPPNPVWLFVLEVSLIFEA